MKGLHKRHASYQCLGFLLCLLSAATLGLGIADVAVNQMSCTSSATCTPVTNGLVLTWVGVGIWASIPVFATGLCLVHFSRQSPDKQMSKHSWLAALIFISAFFFTPAIIGISIAEVILKFASSGAPTMQSDAATQAMFGMPIALAVLGFLMMLIVVHLFVHLCCCKSKKKDATHIEQQHPQQFQQQPPHPAELSSCPQHGPAAGANINEVDRINLWSAYRWMNVGQAAGGGGGCGCNGGNAAAKAAVASSYYSGAGGAPPNRCFHVGGQTPNAACCGGAVAAPQPSAGIYQYPRPMASTYQAARW